MEKEQENSYHKINLNWYPGHMAKTKKQIIEDLKLVDVVIEILDARIPVSSQNPDIQEYLKNKKRIEILNKCDLADENSIKIWSDYFVNKGMSVCVTDANSGRGVREVIKKIHQVTSDIKDKSAQKGRSGKIIRALVIGIPNVGKSSFINRIANKATAKVGNRPGVTRQKQWIRVDQGIELLDTPGVLWPKLDMKGTALNLAYTGTIKDDIIDRTEIAYNLMVFLFNNYKKNLVERYKLENEIDNVMNSAEMEEDKYTALFELIGKKRGALISGGRYDYEKIAGIILDDYRSGKLGKIVLELPKKN